MAAEKQIINISILPFHSQSFYLFGKKVCFVQQPPEPPYACQSHLSIGATLSGDFFSTVWENGATYMIQVLPIIEQYLNVISIFAHNLEYRRLLWKRNHEAHLGTAIRKATSFFFLRPKLPSTISSKPPPTLIRCFKYKHHRPPSMLHR